MNYLRKVDFDAYERTGYEWQYLYHGESCTVIGSNVPAHSKAPPNHVHPVDQLYYVVLGEMQLRLGTERFVAGPDTLVYIPAGTPHHNWNEGDVDEFHFEVLSPVPFATQPLATPTDSTDAGGRPYRVARAADVANEEVMPGFRARKLLGRGDSSEHMTLNLLESAPGSGGPATHVHEFDQLFYILEGEMTVEAALQTFAARPGDLVVLPAGVPHTQYNRASSPERHLALLTPSPAPGKPWDVGVTLEPTGVTHG